MDGRILGPWIAAALGLLLGGCSFQVRNATAVGLGVGSAPSRHVGGPLARRSSGDRDALRPILYPSNGLEPRASAMSQPLKRVSAEAEAGAEGPEHSASPMTPGVQPDEPVPSGSWWETVVAEAQECCERYWTDYAVTAQWPCSYDTLAERAYRDPWDIQAARGRVYSAALFDWHFEPGTAELNAFGKSRLRQILRDPTTDDQKIYIQVAVNASETARRLKAVEEALAVYGRDPKGYPLMLLHDAPASISGPEAQEIQRQLVRSVGRAPSASLVTVASSGSTPRNRSEQGGQAGEGAP